MRRIGVEPEKTQTGTDQCAAEHDQLTGARHVRNQQVFGEFHVTRQVAEDTQGTTDHDRRHDRQAIEAISQVHGVARTDDDEVGQDHETDPQRDGDILEHWHDQRGFDAGRCSHIKEDRRTEAKHRLPEIFPAAWQAARVLLDHLAVVIDPANGAKQQGNDQYHPHVAVGQVSPQQSADTDG
ncbi:hypothetical protein D3C80_515660 [compost metagenome]